MMLRGIRVLLGTFYGIGIIVHGLVLSTIVPFRWVNGGRSDSYRAQAVQSVVSVGILITLFCLTWWLADAKPTIKRWSAWFVLALMGAWTVGLVLQLFGTSFERFGLSVLLAMGVYGHWQLFKYLRALST